MNPARAHFELSLANTGQKGFSLMEALVTATLFTILTAISIPTYRRHTRSAKTAEAKSSLGQIYIAEKSFFINHHFYIPNLQTLQIAPDGELLYNAGFAGGPTQCPNYSGPPIEDKNKSFFELCGDKFGPSSGPMEYCAFQNSKFKRRSPPNGSFTPPSIPASAVTTCATFKAYAIADLINNPPKKTANTPKDTWCINQYKQVIRVRDGTRSKSPAAVSCP